MQFIEIVGNYARVRYDNTKKKKTLHIYRKLNFNNIN